jgi:FkbM family methyltransferase
VRPWSGHGITARLLLAFCRRLPSFRGKGRIYRWAAALLPRGELSLVSPAGVRFRTLADDFIGKTIAYEGAYEPLSINRARAIMRPGGVFIDVGCNVGLYTLSVGSLPGVETVAIDGSYLALNRLSENLLRNPGISAKVVSCGLGPANEMVCFELPVKRNLGTMRIAKENGGPPSASRFWVASTTLETVLERLATPRIRLLKIDVEGFELPVFKGLNFDGPHRPENIIMECDPLFPDALKCFEFLVSNRYEAHTVSGHPIPNLESIPEQNVWFRCGRSKGPNAP